MTNTVLCRPPANKLRGRADAAITHCRKRLAEELRPYAANKVPIITLGKTAAEVILGVDASMGSMRGHWYRDGHVFATWHPAYVLRAPSRMKEFVTDMRKIKHGGPMKVEPIQYKVVETPTELDKFVLAVISESPLVCIDLETDQVVWWEDKILSIGVAWSSTKAFVIPEELVYHERTRKALEHIFDNCRVVGHNFKFDVKFMKHQLGVDNARIDEDSLIAHYVLDENGRHALKTLLAERFDIEDYEKGLVQRYLNSRNDRYGKVPREHLYHYNALDVCYNMLLWYQLEEELLVEGLYDKPYRTPLMDSQQCFPDIELRGVLIDSEQHTALSEQLHAAIDNTYRQLSEMCGRDFNPRSWQQVQPIMYDHYGMPEVTGRGFKVRSTSKAARNKIKDLLLKESEAYKWLELYDKYKSLEKLRSSYVDNLYDVLGPQGCVHPDFLVYGTEVGRLSARDPAIQTIPRAGTGEVDGKKWGKAVRDLFVARPGYVWCKADYSQAELRVAAALSGDEFLLDVYRHNRDLHSEVARAMYGDNFTKEERVLAKMFNFSYLYGGNEHSFAADAGLPINVARDFVRRYNRVMPGLAEWKKGQLRRMKEQGYVETQLGRRRRFPLLTYSNIEDAKKSSVHAPVAGTASDLTLLSLIRLHTMDLEGVKVLITVHDEVDLEIRKDRIDEVVPIIIQTMEDVASEIFPQVPWKADAEIGESWGSIKKWKGS